jgi:hypothetical protein
VAGKQLWWVDIVHRTVLSCTLACGAAHEESVLPCGPKGHEALPYTILIAAAQTLDEFRQLGQAPDTMHDPCCRRW